MGQFQQDSFGPSGKGGGSPSGKGGSSPATSGQPQMGMPNQAMQPTSAIQPNNPVTQPSVSAPSPTSGGGKSAMQQPGVTGGGFAGGMAQNGGQMTTGMGMDESSTSNPQNAIGSQGGTGNTQMGFSQPLNAASNNSAGIGTSPTPPSPPMMPAPMLAAPSAPTPANFQAMLGAAPAQQAQNDARQAFQQQPPSMFGGAGKGSNMLPPPTPIPTLPIQQPTMNPSMRRRFGREDN